MNKITLLPYWQLPDTIPSVYDTQSGSYQEMVAKVYGAMRTLQMECNVFIEEINKLITNFITSSEEDQECFENRMTKVIHDYLDYLDSKVQAQDKVIAEAVSFMKTNLSESIRTLIAEMHASGEFDEAVLNAIENFGSRVISLEAKMLNQETKANDFENRIMSLETNRVETTYDADMEELKIVNVIGGAN